MKIREFNKEKWENGEHRIPTDEEAETLIRMFEECSWCTIRDILVESGLTDENFPVFWYDVRDKMLRTAKLKFMK